MIIKDYEVCSPDMTSGGTSLQGYKTTTYDRLCQVLGPPTFTSADPNDKVNCEWVIDSKWYDANTIYEIDYDNWEYETVTIYNWKDYDGGFRARTSESYRWHIGSRNSMPALELISFITKKLGVQYERRI